MNESFDRKLDAALDALPRQRSPGKDLWPAIESRLAPAPRWRVPAAAAVALVGALALGLWWRSVPDPGTRLPAKSAAFAVNRPDLRHGAELLDRSYGAALLERVADLGHPPPAEQALLRAELRALEAAQEKIRDALATQPGGEYLITLLARTHEMRLDLVNKLAGEPARTGVHHENGNA